MRGNDFVAISKHPNRLMIRSKRVCAVKFTRKFLLISSTAEELWVMLKSAKDLSAYLLVICGFK